MSKLNKGVAAALGQIAKTSLSNRKPSKIVLKRPALRNLILVMLASLRTTTFRINTLAAHLPMLVAHYKTKQKRLLRFINSNFPTDVALVAWCRFVLCWLYNKIGQAPRIVLVDETDILEHYRVIVMAVPFRKRAIPIYWKIYRKDAFDKMVYRSHNALVQEFCYEFIKHFENALPNVRRPILVFDRGFARAKYLMKPFILHSALLISNFRYLFLKHAWSLH